MKKIFIVFALFIISCKKPVTCEDRVKEVIYKIIDGDNESDIQKVLSCYADSAVLMPPGKRPVMGMDAIKRNYDTLFDNSILKLETEIQKVIFTGNTAVAYGMNTGFLKTKKDSATKNIDSKYVMLLKRNKSNEWKITRLIWNDN